MKKEKKHTHKSEEFFFIFNNIFYIYISVANMIPFSWQT